MERQEAQHGAFSSQNNWDLLKPDEEELRRHGDL
jgi:hypothetical protein